MSPQESISHYRIGSKLGQGGMGEVWRASDSKLGREVAIKILTQEFANDPDRMARFHREAQLLASLNHPNIAAIHGVEERALILELVEGPTLADRIAQGAIPLDEALPIARQIAEALEYAHEKGVIHRDLKPANIKVTPEGRVKVLDFGLAKALTEDPAAADPSSSPTMTMRATLAGMIMGTAAYMSPEQAKGKPVDRRADIWAFGVLVVEMLTGRQMYEAETVSEVLAAVITREPDLSVLPPAVPTSIRKLLSRCLQKDPRRRLQAIGEARIILEEPAADDAPVQPALAARARHSRLPWVVVACLLAALAVTGAILWKATRPTNHPLVRLSVDLGADADPTIIRTEAILSADGNLLIYLRRSAVGGTQLAMRRLDQAVATPLGGTEGAIDFSFSPDGQWLAFFTGDKLKKVSLAGGSPVTLCDAANGRGISWAEDGSIVTAFGLTSDLYRVAAMGGAPQLLPDTSGREVRSRRYPQHLPGGESVLYTRYGGKGDWEDAALEVLNLKTGKSKPVLSGGFFGRYLPTGHIIFAHQGGIWGQAFDLGALQVRGPAAPLVDDLAANVTAGIGRFSASGNGTLVYAAGAYYVAGWNLGWLDRSGKTELLGIPSGLNYTPVLSPDGKRSMVCVGAAPDSDLWVLDFERNHFSRFTFNHKANRSPVWTPDGKHVVYVSRSDAGSSVWWARSDGGGEAQLLLESKTAPVPYSFSPDGRRLAFFQTSPGTGSDILMLPIDTTNADHPKAGEPEVFLRTPSNEAVPAFSPDGRWIAYSTQDSGGPEIFVRPFPGPGGPWQISVGGGDYPVWSRDGRALLFKTGDNRIMEATYQAKGDSFVAERPRLWSETRFGTSGIDRGRPFDVSPDGKRAIIPVFPEQDSRKGNIHVTFLLNFFDEVRRRLP